MTKKNTQIVPSNMKAIHDRIVQLTDDFCEQHLNQEYAELCRRMAAALSRKRRSPLAQGRVESWACGIIYALGRVNFLFDKSQTPHMRPDDLCPPFGVSKATAAAKAKKISDSLNVDLLDPKWTLPSKLGDNPMAWLIQVNGLLVDARHEPREIQEEAYRLGLIPYLP